MFANITYAGTACSVGSVSSAGRIQAWQSLGHDLRDVKGLAPRPARLSCQQCCASLPRAGPSGASSASARSLMEAASGSSFTCGDDGPSVCQGFTPRDDSEPESPSSWSGGGDEFCDDMPANKGKKIGGARATLASSVSYNYFGFLQFSVPPPARRTSPSPTMRH